MTSDMGEMFNELKKERQLKREENRQNSPAMLKEHGIAFESKNYGAHLVIVEGIYTFDFWPGTGLFNIRRKGAPSVGKGRGVRKLIYEIEKFRKAQSKGS